MRISRPLNAGALDELVSKLGPNQVIAHWFSYAARCLMARRCGSGYTMFSRRDRCGLITRSVRSRLRADQAGLGQQIRL